MMRNVFAIMKKEFARFFGDRRMLITALIMPGLMIYLLYSFMGQALMSMGTVDQTHVPTVYVVNLPHSIRSLPQVADMDLRDISTNELAETKNQIANKDVDLCLVFPNDFDTLVAEYEASEANPASNIEMFYNSTATESSSLFMRMRTVLDDYESSLANKFDVNRGQQSFDLASDKDTSGFIFSSMLPLLLLIFLFSGCMALAPESIAGEKERGTIATLLITPIKRSELAIGKILSLACLGFLCGLSSTVGTMISLPKLMGAEGDSLNMNIYGTQDYVALALVILSSILVIITLISIISAFSKTVKEANTAVMPLMIVVMLTGVTAMFGGGPQKETLYYFVPLYNSVQTMSGIFSFQYASTTMIITVVSNLVYACIGGYVLTKMFNSEKVIFSK